MMKLKLPARDSGDTPHQVIATRSRLRTCAVLTFGMVVVMFFYGSPWLIYGSFERFQIESLYDLIWLIVAPFAGPCFVIYGYRLAASLDGSAWAIRTRYDLVEFRTPEDQLLHVSSLGEITTGPSRIYVAHRNGMHEINTTTLNEKAEEIVGALETWRAHALETSTPNA